VIYYDKKKFGRAIRAYQKAIKMRADLAVSLQQSGLRVLCGQEIRRVHRRVSASAEIGSDRS